MGDRFREPFENPYIDKDSEKAKFSTVVTMDEIQERWRTGSWEPEDDAFRLPPSFLRGDAEEDTAPSQPEDKEANRFAFDLKKDIIYADETNTEFADAYTDSYRPKGNIGSAVSNIQLDRMRYNALADIPEDLPDDLSYLSGEGGEKRVRPQTPAKDRLYGRLDTPVAKRRAKVEQMIPQREGESTEMIMAEVKKRRAAEDARSGTVRRPKVKRGSGLYDAFSAPGSIEEFSDYDGQDEYEVERVSGSGSWRGSLPEQDGLVPDSRAMPYFGRFSRSWSKIDSAEPTRAELLRHTVNTIYDYEDADGAAGGRFRRSDERREYYVSDRDFDPDDRYRKLSRRRRAVRASKNVLTEDIMSGKFNNPYVQVSDERLRSIINHDMRGPGQSAEPEGLTDPALIHEWNMGYSRVNTDENKYSAWFEEQSRLAEHAEQSRYRGSHRSGRPGAYLQRERPYGEGRRYPGGEYSERESRRRDDRREQMQRAAEQGLADGEEMIRRRRQEEREAEEQRLRDQRAAYEQQQAYFRRRNEEMLRQQEEYFKRQQEEMLRHQRESMRQQEENLHKQQQARQEAYYKRQQEEMEKRRQEYARLQRERQTQQQEYVKRQQEFFRQQQEQMKRQQEQMKRQQPSGAANAGRQPQQGYYPPQQGYYPPQQGYYPQQGYPQQQAYPQPQGYPPQQGYYPPSSQGYPNPSQGGRR